MKADDDHRREIRCVGVAAVMVGCEIAVVIPGR